MKNLKFYDVKKRKAFMSNKYSFMSKRNPRTKRMTYMVKTKSPSGNMAYRIVSKDFYMSKGRK